MSGSIQSGPTLLPGEPRYQQLAEAFASNDLAKIKAIVHPLADMLPMIPERERPSFRTSLAARQNHAVIFHQAKLLDGRNRVRELTALRKPISTAVFSGTTIEALDFVKAENIERRHLNESQRADFAARVAMLPVGANQHTRQSPAQICAPLLPIGGEGSRVDLSTLTEPELRAALEAAEDWGVLPQPLLSQTESAEKFNVSRRLVQHATTYLNKGVPELSEAVQRGDMKVSVAATIAELPIEQQKAIIAAADPKAVKEIAKKNRTEKQTKGRERRLDNMRKPDATPLLSGGEKAGVLFIDIPRKFVQWSEATGAEKSPENHYRVETFEFLARMRDQILARCRDDVVLFMWAWANSLLDQIDLMAEWGFVSRRPWGNGRLLRGPDGRILAPCGEGRYRTHQIWAKRASTGNYNRGTGFWFIDCHELLLVAARGDVPAPIMGTQAMSILDAPVGDYSAKPADFRKQIDAYFPGVPKLELFGRVDDPAVFRSEYPDWQVWGNDVSPSPQGEVDSATPAQSEALSLARAEETVSAEVAE